jgi:cob(I)alamin adenosyltransferase
MGNRLTKIYTRTGDNGTTSLADGTRCSKAALRIEVIGTVDELNSHIGVLLAEVIEEDVRLELENIQHDLFDLGGELSIPGHIRLGIEQVGRLESEINEYNAHLPPLKEFILPGGVRSAAACHVARVVCRRAERTMVKLAQDEAVNVTGIHYLNRLSDLLFVLCRVLNRRQGKTDVLWQPGKNNQGN